MPRQRSPARGRPGRERASTTVKDGATGPRGVSRRPAEKIRRGLARHEPSDRISSDREYRRPLIRPANRPRLSGGSRSFYRFTMRDNGEAHGFAAEISPARPGRALALGSPLHEVAPALTSRRVVRRMPTGRLCTPMPT